MDIDIKNQFETRIERSKKRRDKRRKICIVVSITLLGVIAISIKEVSSAQHNIQNINFQDSGESGNIQDNNTEIDSASIETASAENSTQSNEYLMLINKSSDINKDYVPQDLVIPNIRFKVANDMCREMRAEAAEAIENMFNAAKEDGINLIAISGYRSYDYQKVVYDRSVATDGQEYTDNYVAVPGTSEHQTGLVMDMLSDEYLSLDEGFENTNAFKWLMDNMSKYGFILRYPKGKEDITGYDYEPWHLRYVGVDAAKEIMDNGITLEEYINK